MSKAVGVSSCFAKPKGLRAKQFVQRCSDCVCLFVTQYDGRNSTAVSTEGRELHAAPFWLVFVSLCVRGAMKNQIMSLRQWICTAQTVVCAVCVVSCKNRTFGLVLTVTWWVSCQLSCGSVSVWLCAVLCCAVLFYIVLYCTVVHKAATWW
jgi:hypothetical protein